MRNKAERQHQVVAQKKKYFRIYRILGSVNAAAWVCANWLIYPIDHILRYICFLWGAILLIASFQIYQRFISSENKNKDHLSTVAKVKTEIKFIVATLIMYIAQLKIPLLKPVFGWMIYLLAHRIMFHVAP